MNRYHNSFLTRLRVFTLFPGITPRICVYNSVNTHTQVPQHYSDSDSCDRGLKLHLVLSEFHIL